MTDGDIRVALVSNYELFRVGVRLLLELEKDLTVTGNAERGEAALKLIAATRPDVVLLDIDLPGTHAAEATLRLTSTRNIKVIVMSMQDDAAVVRQFLDLGANGYLLKSTSTQDLVAAIRRVHSNAADQIVLSVSRGAVTRPVDGPLSARERAVLTLASQALSNAQISTHLEISESTVKRHLHNIFRKLGATSRMDAVHKASAANLIDPPPAAPTHTPRAGGWR